MSTLICNAAEGVLQIVLVRDGATLCAQEWPAPTRSTEILAPAIAHMLHDLGMEPREISRIACVHGPGSFTGIRLVLSTAAAMRRALQATVAPVDYMEALALSTHQRLQDLPCPAGTQPAAFAAPPTPALAIGDDTTIVWVLTHARRNLVHCQPFALPKPALAPLAKPATSTSSPEAGPHALCPSPPLAHAAPQALAAVDLCSLEACAQRINNLSAAPLCVGSGLLRNAAFFHHRCPQAHYGGPSYATVRLEALVHLAERASYGHDDLSPLYIRPCDAVENLPAMAVKLGHDATTAEQRLAALLQRPTSPDQTYRPSSPDTL